MPRRGEPRWGRSESIVPRSAPPSSKWVAKEWRKAWVVAFIVNERILHPRTAGFSPAFIHSSRHNPAKPDSSSSVFDLRRGCYFFYKTEC